GRLAADPEGRGITDDQTQEHRADGQPDRTEKHPQINRVKRFITRIGPAKYTPVIEVIEHPFHATVQTWLQPAVHEHQHQGTQKEQTQEYGRTRQQPEYRPATARHKACPGSHGASSSTRQCSRDWGIQKASCAPTASVSASCSSASTVALKEMSSSVSMTSR